MAVEIPTVGRTRTITGAVLLERWIQADAGTTQITADRNALNAAANARALEDGVGRGGGPIWFGAPSPGDFDPGVTFQDWYGRQILLPFVAVETKDQASTLEADIETFIHSVFPGEDIQGPNRRFTLPVQQGDLSAKCWAWDLEFD